MKALICTLMGIALGFTATTASAFIQQTQSVTLQGSITPVNSETNVLLIFSGTGVITIASLPDETAGVANLFSATVSVPVSAPSAGVLTILGLYGSVSNPTPVSVLMNVGSGLTATTPPGQAFTTAFPTGGFTEAQIATDLANPSPANNFQLQSFFANNVGQMVTLSGGTGIGSLVTFSNGSTGGSATLALVPEPPSFWMLLAGAAALAGIPRLRKAS